MTSTPFVGSIECTEHSLYEKHLWKSNFRFRENNDTTPPVTTISFDPPKPTGENGWYLHFVIITLMAKDDISGVNATYYRINEGEWILYTSLFKVEEEGIYRIEYYSIDNAGNTEKINSSDFKIDNRSPFIHLDNEKVKRNKRKFTATCIDFMSGVERVEFYYNDELKHIDYEEPYEWIVNISSVVDERGMKTQQYESDFYDAHAYDYAGREGLPIKIITPIRYIGFILNPEFSKYKVTFFALIVYIPNIEEVVKYENLTLCTIGSLGYIGRFFIRAAFYYDWPPGPLIPP